MLLFPIKNSIMVYDYCMRVKSHTQVPSSDVITSLSEYSSVNEA